MVDKFDLAAAISGIVSESSTGAPEVKMIPLEDIIPNPANFYTIDKGALRPLMDSIAMDGLHHYPLVIKHPKEEGKWQLIDGERRYTACCELVKEGHEELKSIPCTVKEYGSTALAELQLILSNSTNRVLSNAEIMKQAEKTEMLFYQLKEEGYEFPGRMRDQVAAACKVSPTKLAKLKVIRDGLIPEFASRFEADDLSEQASYALARMPADLQSRIYGIIGTKGLNGYAAENVLKHHQEEGCLWDAASLQCPDGKACPGADRFLRHDLEDYWTMCGGAKCCLECNYSKVQYSPCKRMCSKAEAQRKAALDAEKAEGAKQTERKFKKCQRETQVNAQRLLKAIDASGISDKTVIKWDYRSNTVSEIREWAEGEFGGIADWHYPRLDPKDLRNPIELCKILGCSADYLLGLTDELNPTDMELKWKSPDCPPVPDRKVVAKFRLPGEEEVCQKIVKWNGEDWCFPSGAVIDIVCLGWWPIPEVD